MTAAPLTEVLDRATRQRCAVAGLVVLGWEDARAFVEAADETGLPVILQAGPGCRRYTPVPVLGKMFRHLADETRVPVVCHIDHAYTVEECAAGIEHGFTSVMIDGSALPIAQTSRSPRAWSRWRRRAGVSVEGEVGFVGYAGGRPSAVTSPADAHRFAPRAAPTRWRSRSAMCISRRRNPTASTSRRCASRGGHPAPAGPAWRLRHSPHVRRKLARETRVEKFNIGTELRMAFGAALRKSLADDPAVFDRLELLGNTITPLKVEAKAVITGLVED